jgi:hypothetical protein
VYFSPNSVSGRGFSIILLWHLESGLGRTRVCFGAPVVVPPLELLVKSQFCEPHLESRPDFESSRRADSESGLCFPVCAEGEIFDVSPRVGAVVGQFARV